MRHHSFASVAVKQLFSKPSCEKYPFVPSEAAEKYRGRIAYDPSKCIGCGMCERVCAGNAITRTVEKGAEGEGDKVTLTFNLGSCTFCANCADFCTHKAISLTKDYHMIATKEEDLLVSGSFIKAPPRKPAAKPVAAAAAAEAPAEPVSSIKPREDGKPVNDPARCVYCTICARKCPSGALTVDRAAKTWVLDEEKCVGCGACADNCPKKCIII